MKTINLVKKYLKERRGEALNVTVKEAELLHDFATWLDEQSAQQGVQSDEFSGHANNCVLRSGGYACTCGAVETARR